MKPLEIWADKSAGSKHRITDSDINNNNLLFLNGYYLHGHLESLNDYDCCYISIDDESPEKSYYNIDVEQHSTGSINWNKCIIPVGIYPCVVHLYNEDTNDVELHDALLFTWVSNDDQRKGLITSLKNPEAMSDALNKYINAVPLI